MKNIYRALFCLLLTVAVSASFAQSPTEQGLRASKIVDEVRQLDLMNKILPIIWTKAQLNTALPAIEKVRKNVLETHGEEYKILVSLQTKVEAALDKALKEGSMPSKELLNELEKSYEQMDVARAAIGKNNEDLVFDVLNPLLNAGQKKAMANALNPSAMDPDLKTEKMTDEEKMRFFIRNILLDPLAYDLLVKLSQSSATPDK